MIATQKVHKIGKCEAVKPDPLFLLKNVYLFLMEFYLWLYQEDGKWYQITQIHKR